MKNLNHKLLLFIIGFFAMGGAVGFVFFGSQNFPLKFVAAWSDFKTNFYQNNESESGEQSNIKDNNRLVVEKAVQNIVENLKGELERNYLPGVASGVSEDNNFPKRHLNEQEINPDCKYAAVIDSATEAMLYAKNADMETPIASLTKLMTALIVLDYGPRWEEYYQIRSSDRREGGKIYLYQGENIRIKDLLFTALVGSDNTAAVALMNSIGMSEDEFVVKMNEKAQVLGLKNTSFADPTGLSDRNISTAREAALLAKFALAEKEIREATLVKNYEFETKEGRRKSIPSTDYLLGSLPPNGLRLIGGKTGYTLAAGFCFVGEFLNEAGNEILAVVLNSSGYSARFTETKRLAEWAYENYDWPARDSD